MHKNLHKNLYSKRDKKHNYPPVNKITTSTDNVDNETEQKLTVDSIKNKSLLTIFSSLIISGLIIFGYSLINSSSQSEIILSSVKPIDIIYEDSISATTSTSSTTTSTSSTTTSTSSTTVPVVVENI